MPKRVQLEIHFIFGTWNVFVGVSLSLFSSPMLLPLLLPRVIIICMREGETYSLRHGISRLMPHFIDDLSAGHAIFPLDVEWETGTLVRAAALYHFGDDGGSDLWLTCLNQMQTLSHVWLSFFSTNCYRRSRTRALVLFISLPECYIWWMFVQMSSERRTRRKELGNAINQARGSTQRSQSAVRIYS
jgi:hypothetical protein